MRRKSSGQGNYSNNNNNNQQRKQRFQGGGGGGGGGNHHNNNRPRKNYGAMREKYLQQARDALSQGDRVLAENYYQHADHCYRMMVEEGYNTRNNNNFNNNNQQQGDAGNEPQEQAAGNVREEQPMHDDTDTVTQLPAFLTGSVIEEDRAPVAPQNWEEQ